MPEFPENRQLSVGFGHQVDRAFGGKKNMIRRSCGHLVGRSLLLSCALGLFISAQSRPQGPPSGQTVGSLSWESKVRLRQRLKSMPGDLVFGEQGVEFRPVKGSALRWSFTEVKTVDLHAPRRLSLTSYENRGWHRGGDRKFRFELNTAVPPSVGAELVQRVGKPAINGDPDPRAPSFATLPARHWTRTGGSNGILRFRDDGIDYVTTGGQGGRSWRWADIQTLANPTPYQLRVGAYLETFDFELKQPMSPDLFDRLWDHAYARDLNVGQTPGGVHHAE